MLCTWGSLLPYAPLGIVFGCITQRIIVLQTEEEDWRATHHSDEIFNGVHTAPIHPDSMRIEN